MTTKTLMEGHWRVDAAALVFLVAVVALNAELPKWIGQDRANGVIALVGMLAAGRVGYQLGRWDERDKA